MIYKPYNVYPHNNSIDAAERNTFSFIFSGDSLTYMDYHFYDTSNNSLSDFKVPAKHFSIA